MEKLYCEYCYDGQVSQMFDIPHGMENGNNVLMFCKGCLAELGEIVVKKLLSKQTSPYSEFPTWQEFTEIIGK